MEVFRHRCWLGHGSYGDVQLCEVSPQVAAVLLEAEQREGNYTSESGAIPVVFALKTLKHAHDDGKVMRLALREVQVLRGLKHPNIAKLQFAFTTPSGRVCMAFEYGGKSMHQLLESRFPTGIPQPLLKRIAYQLLQALRYLHERKVIHRDIKPANVLLDSSEVLRLCDFGFARYTVSDTGHPERLTPYVITRWYRAPEVLVGLPYGFGADIWSLGVTLAELATGQPLLPGDSPLDQLKRIVATTGPLPPLLASRLSRHVREATPEFQQPAASTAISTAALRRQLAAARPGACMDLEDPLLALLAACLTPHPDQRPSAAELLQLPYFDDVATLFRGHPLADLHASALESAASTAAAFGTAASYNAVGGGTLVDVNAGAGPGTGSMLSHASALVPDSASHAQRATSPWKQQHQQAQQEQKLQQHQPHLQRKNPPQTQRKQSPQIQRQSAPLETRPQQQQPQPLLMSQEAKPVYQPRPPPPSSEMQPRLRPMRATAATASGSLTHTSSGGVDGSSPPDAGSASINVNGVGGGRRPWSTTSSTDISGLGSSLAASCNASGPDDGSGGTSAAAPAGGSLTSEGRQGRDIDGDNGEGEADVCWQGRAGAAVPGKTVSKTPTMNLTTAPAPLFHTHGAGAVQEASLALQVAEQGVGIPSELDSLEDFTIAAGAAAAPTAVETSPRGGVLPGIDWALAAPGKFIKGNAGGVLSREATIRIAATAAAFTADAGITAAAIAAAHQGPPRRRASNGYVEAPPNGALPTMALPVPPHKCGTVAVATAAAADVKELSGGGANDREAIPAAADCGGGDGPSRDQTNRYINEMEAAASAPTEADTRGVAISTPDPWGTSTASGAVNCEVRASLVCPAFSLPAAASNPTDEFLPAATSISAQLLAPSAVSVPSSRAIWPPGIASHPRPAGTKQHVEYGGTITATNPAPAGKANPMDHGTMGHFPLHRAASAKPRRLQPPPQWLAGFYHDCSPSSYGNLAASALTSTEAAAVMPCTVSPGLDSLTNATTLHLNWKSAASPDGDDVALAAFSAAASRATQPNGNPAAATHTVVARDQLTYGYCRPAGSCQPLILQSLQPPQPLQQPRHQAALNTPRIGLTMRAGAESHLQLEPQQSTRVVEPRAVQQQHSDGRPAGQQHGQQRAIVDSAFLPYARTGFSVNNDEGPAAPSSLLITTTTTAPRTQNSLPAATVIATNVAAGIPPTLRSEQTATGSTPLPAPCPHVGLSLHGPDRGVRLGHGSIAAVAMNTTGDAATHSGGVAALAWAAPPTQSEIGNVGHGVDDPVAKGSCGLFNANGSDDFRARPFVGCKGVLPGWLRRGKRWFRQTIGAL